MASCFGDVAAAAAVVAAGIDVDCCDGCMYRGAVEAAVAVAAPWPSSSCDDRCHAAAAEGVAGNVAGGGAVVSAVGCDAADRWHGVDDRAVCGVGAGADDADAGCVACGGGRSNSGR